MVHQGQLVRWQLYSLKSPLFYCNYSKALRYTDLADALILIRFYGFEPHIFYRVAELIIALMALSKLLFYQNMRGFESPKYSNSNP